jgi:hypothetical protein
MRLQIALIVMLALVGCAKPPAWAPAETNITGSRIETPIDLPAHGMPVVQVAQPGSAQKSFGIIDTGAGAAMVTPGFAVRNHLARRSAADLQMRDALNKTQATPQVAHVETLGVGNSSFRNFDAIVDDLPVLKAMSDQLELVLARPLFRDVLLTIDYPRRKLSIEQGTLPEPNGRDVLPLKTDDRGHLLLPVNLGGEDAWLIVDTGHTGQGLLLSRYRLIAMRWASTPVEGDQVKSFLGTTRSRVGRMNGDMTIGQYTIRRPIVAIAYDDDREFIGADVLRHFAVTIDQKNNRIRLASPFTGPAATQPIVVPPVRRFGFDFTDSRGTVQVIHGSEAAAAGLKDGDRIVAMNGLPLERMTYLHQEAMEKSNAPLILRIERGGRPMVLRVPLTVVVP